jgi:acetyltransferase-like isoleucine patch superfamily enzyme
MKSFLGQNLRVRSEFKIQKIIITMGKFVYSPIQTICKQTNKKIEIGDHCLYIPGFGYFHEESIIYKDKNKTGGLRPYKIN